jgi:choline dehydrogenase-like flavoprotein
MSRRDVVHFGRSQFTSSATENPTMTIVALAIRQADFIAAQMVRREP